jgi:hypothetical protein
MSAFAGTLNQSAMRHGRVFLAILASAWVGLLLAGAAYTLEPPRLPTDSAPPMTLLAANEFEAVLFIEDRTDAATAPSTRATRNDEQAAQLFGMKTEPVGTSESPEKWHRVEAAMAQDFAVVEQCHANGTCPVAAQRLIDIIAEGAGRIGRHVWASSTEPRTSPSARPVTRYNGALRIIGAIRSKRSYPIAVTVRTTQSSNMLRFWRLAFPRTM